MQYPFHQYHLQKTNLPHFQREYKYPSFLQILLLAIAMYNININITPTIIITIIAAQKFFIIHGLTLPSIVTHVCLRFNCSCLHIWSWYLGIVLQNGWGNISRLHRKAKTVRLQTLKQLAWPLPFPHPHIAYSQLTVIQLSTRVIRYS